jgi:hypothetical protein
MKRFIIADGCIQGVLALVCIIYIPLYGYIGQEPVFPPYYLIFALLGWQLCSSLIHIAERNRLPRNKYLYALQLILLGYCTCIGISYITTKYITSYDWLTTIFFYLFGGILTLLPALMISITFLTVRRMFIPLRQTV